MLNYSSSRSFQVSGSYEITQFPSTTLYNIQLPLNPVIKRPVFVHLFFCCMHVDTIVEIPLGVFYIETRTAKSFRS